MIYVLLKNIKKIILGWFILVPFSYLIPKKKNLMVFFGKDEVEFFGNVKYMFLHMKSQHKEADVYFITENKKVFKKLKEHGIAVLYYPSFKTLYTLFRAKFLFVNDFYWTKRYKYYILFRAKKIQTWHGITLKKIHLAVDSPKNRDDSFKGRLEKTIKGKNNVNDLFVSCSTFFTENAFSLAFKYKHVVESGYPRNDVLFRKEMTEYDLIGTDISVSEQIRLRKSKGHKIVLYAPTFRDTGGDAISDGVISLPELSEFGNKNDILFVFKFHPSIGNLHDLSSYENIVEYKSSCDIQPLLNYSDLLVTDYSSVYMDYLLLDRPVVFFPYDLDKYREKDRELFFDYDEITPGYKSHNQNELFEALEKNLVEKIDEFRDERKKVCGLAYEYCDGDSSERIWNYIKKLWG